jgi:hypothetical protein
VTQPQPAKSSMTGIDSPRWCAHCQTYGDHHTDRCRQTTAKPAPTWKCEYCGRFYSERTGAAHLYCQQEQDRKHPFDAPRESTEEERAAVGWTW